MRVIRWPVRVCKILSTFSSKTIEQASRTKQFADWKSDKDRLRLDETKNSVFRIFCPSCGEGWAPRVNDNCHFTGNWCVCPVCGTDLMEASK